MSHERNNQYDPSSIPINHSWRPSEEGYISNFNEMSLIWAAEVSHCVDTIYSNRTARDLLSRNDRYLVHPDFLANHALITSPPERSTAAFITPQSWTRAITTAKVSNERETVSYNGLTGRYIMTKGTSMSGYAYGEIQTSLPPFNGVPMGFFGARDAAKELEIGNILLQHDFRASLPLGYVVYNPDRLKNAITELWASDEEVRDNILYNLETVAYNGDLPAALVRITGSKTRVNQAVGSHNISDVLEGLSTLPGISFEILEKLRTRKILSEGDIFTIGGALTKIIYGNARALYSLLPKLPQYAGFDSILTAPKDLDVSLCIQDYEEAGEPTKIPDRINTGNIVNQYKVNMLETVTDFISRTMKSRYHSSLSEPMIQKLKTQLL